MSKLAKRLTQLEQTQDSQPQQVEQPTEPHTKEDIARWWASQLNWPRAAQVMGMTEAEVIERWGAEFGWFELQATIAGLNEQALELCQVEEKKPAQKPEEQQPPDYLRQAEPKYRHDRRRWDPRRRRA